MVKIDILEDVHEESKPKKHPKSPEEKANFISKLTFLWVFPLVFKGFRKPLQEDDLYVMNHKDSSEYVYRVFLKHWSKEKAKAKPNLTRALFKSWGLAYLACGLLKFFQDLSLLGTPLMLRFIIESVEKEEDLWKTFLWAFAMLFLMLFRAVIEDQYFHRIYRIGVRVRGALVMALYEKSLKLSSEARGLSTVGEITNLMSNDSQRFQEILTYLHVLWSGPLQITLALIQMCLLLGWAPVIGGILLVLNIPLQKRLGGLVAKFRRKQMKVTDKRVRLINEILQGMKVIKLYAWESFFAKQVATARSAEMRQLRKSSIIRAFVTTSMMAAPIIIATVTLVIYASVPSKYGGGDLEASKVFPALTLFNIIRFPLMMLPMVINNIGEARVALSRLAVFLLRGEMQDQDRSDDFLKVPSIDVEGGLFKWAIGNAGDPIPERKSKKQKKAEKKKKKEEEKKKKAEAKEMTEMAGNMGDGKAPAKDADESEEESEKEEFQLEDINLSTSGPELTMIVGRVASGKSSLASALLGEMAQVEGTLKIRGRVAYCAQQPWIMNATLRDNITFGRPFDEAKYYDTLYSCSMLDDVSILPGGDMTEIGEKGINLSGGQKARVALARAMYSDADIYVLDDPLSAVDTHVGDHIFHNCIRGALRNKTVIFVTNQLQWVKHATKIYKLEGGRIDEAGNFEELMAKPNGKFAELIKSHTGLESDKKKKSLKLGGLFSKKKKEVTEEEEEEAAKDKKENALLEMKLKRQADEKEKAKEETDKENTKKGKLVKKEHRETGAVKFSIYISYFVATGLIMGPVLISFVMLMYLCIEIVRIGNDFWLSLWIDDTFNMDTWFYIAVYVGFTIAVTILTFFRAVVFFEITIRSSTSLHSRLMKSVNSATMEFFDTTPIGRVLNRFSKDIDMIDSQLPFALNMTLNAIFILLGGILVVGYVTPWFVLFLVPVLIAYYMVQQFYRRSGRQLRRLDGLTRSPLYALFSETLSGAGTIRAYNDSGRFISTNQRMLDDNQRAYFLVNAANRWLSFNLSFCGVLIVGFAAVFGILSARGKLLRKTDASLLGLSLVYAMQFSAFLQMMVRTFSNLESIMSAVERVNEYRSLKAESTAESVHVPPSWPSKGVVSINKARLGYRENLPDVLKGISFETKPTEKVGIVGRTGAGKSSILVALFRLVDLREGSVEMDGIDISKISTHTLRSRLAIIPQDPILFSGTLRNNLDPEHKHSDADLWKILEKIELKESVENMKGKLRAEVKEYGENFSVGERQLICLGRALLRGSKILMLDEATAAVDIETDAKIQKTIAREFADCTVLTIAHRLNTIIDSDRVLVMDDGRVAEFDTPHNLFQMENGIFHEMVNKMGDTVSSHLKGIAAEKHAGSDKSSDTNGSPKAPLLKANKNVPSTRV